MKHILFLVVCAVAPVAMASAETTVTLKGGGSATVKPGDDTTTVVCESNKSRCTVKVSGRYSDAYDVILDGEVLISLTSIDAALAAIEKIKAAGLCQ